MSNLWSITSRCTMCVPEQPSSSLCYRMTAASLPASKISGQSNYQQTLHSLSDSGHWISSGIQVIINNFLNKRRNWIAGATNIWPLLYKLSRSTEGCLSGGQKKWMRGGELAETATLHVITCSSKSSKARMTSEKLLKVKFSEFANKYYNSLKRAISLNINHIN